MTDEVRQQLDVMQFLEHAPRPHPVDDQVADLRELIQQALFEQEPDAIYRRWLAARVKFVGHNAQTPEERDFAVVQEFDTNFVHGGFEKLFYGAYGNKLSEVVEVLGRVGATDTQDLLQESMDMLGTPFPTKLSDRKKLWNSKCSKKIKKNRWELDLDEHYQEYFDLEERCVDVAAKYAVAGYAKRGMPIPPQIPAKPRVE